MTTKKFILTQLLTLLVLFSYSQKRSNVIYILTNDMGYGDPAERVNLADKYPDQINHLLPLLEQFSAKTK